MADAGRYPRLFASFARYALLRELMFRGNFLVKAFVELLWLMLLLVFYRTVFTKTSYVAGWSETEYLLFVGCYFVLEGVMEGLFLSNCNGFADLVRTGDLDFYLLKPIDEQFLITLHDVEWSSLPNILLGVAVACFGLHQLGWPVAPGMALLAGVLFVCGIAIAYSLLLLLTSTSVWLMRNQSLWELWWLFTSLARYPKEIYVGRYAYPLGWFFTFVLPILLVVNLPARALAKNVLDPWLAVYMAAAAVVLLFVSRRVFKMALRRYRSASS
jgi:ABC-2 type transport system permease protein